MITNGVWSYETPLEPVPAGVTLNPRVIVINGMPWQARSDCLYQHDYYAAFDEIERSKKFSAAERKKFPLINELNILRNLIKKDLWFLVYFVLKNPLANHPFAVDRAWEIQNETGDTVEVWARDHLKTTIITKGRKIQQVLNNPEHRCAIFSATRPLALKIQKMIATVLESPILVQCFPDVLYANPEKESPSWSQSPEGGLIVKRKGMYHEATFSSWGLIEGMPTGDHYSLMVCDDIETPDLKSPESIEAVKDNFDLLASIATRDCQTTVVGTYYSHVGPLVYIGSKEDPATGKKIFQVRRVPATIDGTMNGASVFLPETALAKKRAGKKRIFYCQQLVNPTPRGEEKLNFSFIKIIPKEKLPEKYIKVMLVDGSGTKGRRADREADPYAMGVFGIEQSRDFDGQFNAFILDLWIGRAPLDEALKKVVEMYCRNGRIRKLGVEKVGQSSMEIHVAAALRAKGRYISEDAGTLHILNPRARAKQDRIEEALLIPLNNSKIHMLDTIQPEARNTLKTEMERFPAWHDDGLDILSYLWDIAEEFRFAQADSHSTKQESKYDAAFKAAREGNNKEGWIEV